MNDYDELLDLIYETSSGTGQWSSALHAISDELGGCSFIMCIHSTRTEERFVTGARIDPDALSVLEQRYATPETSPVVALMPRLPVAKLVPRKAVYPDERYFRSEPYNEVFRPLGLAHVAMSCTLRNASCLGTLGILREQRRTQPDPDQHDFQPLKRLLPHINRAVRLHQRFASMGMHQCAMEEVVARLPHGVIMVNRNSRVLYANQAAETLLSREDGVKLSAGILQAVTVAETQALQRLIAAMTANTRAPDSAGSGMVLYRPWPRRPLWVSVLPIPAQLEGVALGIRQPRPTALVMVCDPEKLAELPGDNLQRLYGLTPAEARLAQALCNGMSLNEYAEASGLTVETVRWRLKQVLAKTGTHRQGELIRLLLASTVDLGVTGPVKRW